jgi:hypothetical protein
MTKKAILILATACLILAVIAIPVMTSAVEDDHSDLQTAIYPQTNVNCMNERYSLRFCKVCSVLVDVNTINPIGHKWDEWKETLKPTCEKDGEQSRTCSGYNCKEAEKKVISALGHDDKGDVVKTAATDAANGYQMITCTRCNEKVKKHEHALNKCGANNPEASKNPTLWIWINIVTDAPPCTASVIYKE